MNSSSSRGAVMYLPKPSALVSGMALIIASGLVSAPALAQSASGNASNAALRSQVQQLMTLLHTMSEQNQAQIDALAAQVKELQAKVASNPQPVAATPASAGPHVAQSLTDRLSLESADKKDSIALTGRVNLDVGGYLNYDPQKGESARQLTNGFNARRARIGVTGTVFGDWGYSVIYDAGNSSDAAQAGLQTAQVVYKGLKGASFEIGYSDTFFTLDEATSSNDIMFMERALPSNIATGINAGDFRSNVGARFYGDRYWVGGYFTGPSTTEGSSNASTTTVTYLTPPAKTPGTGSTSVTIPAIVTSGDSHTLSAERFGAFERAAFQVLQGPDYSLHLGVGVDELIRAPNTGPGTAGTITLSDRPDLRIDPTALVSTGSLASSVANEVTGATVFDVETAAGWRNLYWQGEYYHYNVNRNGLADSAFDGGYGEVSWTLTGEARKYLPASGAYSAIVPAHNFSPADGYWGAIELAGRVDYVDLDDLFNSGLTSKLQPNAVDGGRALDFTAGVNWYMNSYIRFMLDYVHSKYDRNLAAVALGKPGVAAGYTMDALALRTQVTW